MFTMGVEEEFILLEPDGTVAPVAADVVRRNDRSGQIKPEFMAYQVETATRVCHRVDELRADLARLRLAASDSTERLGARLVSVGIPPFRVGSINQITADARYTNLAWRFPEAVIAGGACACQVHVGVPDRDLRVQVLARIRPWLDTLLALSVNSPISAGLDTGWHSHRYRRLLHWPTFRPPAIWANGDRYDHAIDRLVATGAAADPDAVYLLARLSTRYPTVEVRVADAALTVEDALLLATIVRALVATLVDDAQRGRPITPARQAKVRAALLDAARDGRPTGVRDKPARRPGTERGTDRGLERLMRRIRPALERFGDIDDVVEGLTRLGAHGTGADRQRRIWTQASGSTAFVTSLADAAVSVPAG